MSQDQPEVLESRPSALTSNPRQEAIEDKDHGTLDNPLRPDQIRPIIRLFQCRECSLPLRDPVTLPCGRSLCRGCLPEARPREHISYPASPGRRQGFECPFTDCGRTHAMCDCGADVILSKVVGHFSKAIERSKADTEHADSSLTIRITAHPERVVTGVPTMTEEFATRVVEGGRLAATYYMANSGELDYDMNVSYDQVSWEEERVSRFDDTLYMQVKESVRTEMDCQVCYALFYDPLTTVCGHTFCRACLHRVLDHSLQCPICRRTLSIRPLLHQQTCPSNEYLTNIINTFWADAVLTRGDALAAEALSRDQEFDIPIFVCTVSLPTMPTFLHIFEPRYRLMMRRVLEGDRTFGMVLPRRPTSSNDAYFWEYGTLLRIDNAAYLADGRSIIETQGISRFRVERHGMLDGYTVAKIERFDDISLQEEEEMEAREVQTSPLDRISTSVSGTSRPGSALGDEHDHTITRDDIARMPTREMLDLGISFVNRARQQGVPGLVQPQITEYPEDGAHFPWWFAGTFPVKIDEKYKLLQTTSVRERLKMCCGWIVEWERRSRPECRIF